MLPRNIELVSIITQFNPFCSLTTNFSKISFNIIYLLFSLHTSLFPFNIFSKLFGLPISLFPWLHKLTQWHRVLCEKLIVAQLVKKFSAFLWNLKVHYPNHKGLSLGSMLWRRNMVSVLTTLPAVLTFTNSTFYLQSVFIGFVWFSE
jgi:hypothetical protein